MDTIRTNPQTIARLRNCFRKPINHASTKLDNDQLERITAMVNEYQGNIGKN